MNHNTITLLAYILFSCIVLSVALYAYYGVTSEEIRIGDKVRMSDSALSKVGGSRSHRAFVGKHVYRVVNKTTDIDGRIRLTLHCGTFLFLEEASKVEDHIPLHC